MINTSKKTEKSGEYFRKLHIIFAALLVGQILFFIVTFAIINKTKTVGLEAISTNSDLLLFAIISVVMSIAGYFIGSIVVKNMLAKSKSKTILQEKISNYRSISIVRWATIEGPTLFSIICLLLTKNIFFVILFGVLIMLFISLRPSKDKLANDLDLSPSERSKLDDSEAIISYGNTIS